MSQIPGPAEPLVNPETGHITVPWFQFFMRLIGQLLPNGVAPGDGGYVVTVPDGNLPNARVATDSATVDVDLTVPGIITWHATGAVVVVDPAGALDGDGTALDPLAVRVDGSTIVINGSNQLQAIGASGSGWAPLSTGAEPLVLVSDGAGQCVMVPYP